ncbi:MAG: hypothetical protein WCD44_00110 [Candidatus Babeliales bacterium]
MLSLSKRINTIIWWHMGESIVYHGFLLAHQLLLFATISASLYGLIGSLFSAIYLTVTISNAGLDITLSSLYPTYIRSKQSITKLLGIQLLINCSISSIIIIGMATFWHQNNFFTRLFPIILLLIFIENVKKLLKVILQLSLQFNITVLGELLTIISYVCLIWGCYAIGFSITPYLIFSFLLFVTVIETLLFFHYVYYWFMMLPSSVKQIKNNNMYKEIIKNRTVTFLNQIHHSFFSGNFLVLITTKFFGFDCAGIIKFSSSIAFNITTIVKKIFGTTTNILVASIKNKNIKIQQNFFSTITSKMYHVLFCLSIFFIINYKLLLPATGTDQHVAIYLSFLIIFIENFFITYEQFYIMQDKKSYLLFLNCFTLFLLYSVYSSTILFSVPLLLLVIFLIRLFYFIATGILSFFLWQFKPIKTIRPFYIMSSILISLIVWFYYN